jgi:hypothetical protein
MMTMTALLLNLVLAAAGGAGAHKPDLSFPEADESGSEYAESAPLVAAPVEIVRVPLLVAAPVEIVRVPLVRAAPVEIVRVPIEHTPALASRARDDRR